jgi:hypothetical protein
MKKTPKKPTTPKKTGPGRPKKTVSGLPDIRPGKPVKIDGLGDPFGGEYSMTPTSHTIGDGGYGARFESARVKAKAPKKAATPKKPRGRPRKNGHGRIDVYVGLSPAFLVELDAFVRALRVKVPGAGRGDVLSKALRAYRPFRLWRLQGGA